MAKNVELFDLERGDFVQKILEWADDPMYANTHNATLGEVRGVAKVLARVLWALGQRVKRLEREE